MRMLRRFLAVLVLTFFLSTPAWATYPLASDLAGVVVDANQQPIAGATVIIRHLDTGRVVVKTTNQKGRYLAKNLRSDGRYLVTVLADQGVVAFRPGTLDLGERMRRNAVLGADATNPPPFMRAWQWKQTEVLVQPTLGVTS
jgi:hypothetical protein